MSFFPPPTNDEGKDKTKENVMGIKQRVMSFGGCGFIIIIIINNNISVWINLCIF